MNNVTIHHTATSADIDVDTMVASATRHHGVAPAHYFIDAKGNVRNPRSTDVVVGATRSPEANRTGIHIELV